MCSRGTPTVPAAIAKLPVIARCRASTRVIPSVQRPPRRVAASSLAAPSWR
jgi:hypothetical protein